MKLSRRENLLLSVSMGIIIIGFIYSGAIHSGAARLSSLDQRIRQAESELARVNGILARQDAVEQAYKSLERKLVERGVSETVSTEILQDVKARAAESGLNVLNIKPFRSREEGGYEEFDFKLEMEGELSELGSFLYDLNASAYIFQIKNMLITAQLENENLKIQLLLSALTTHS